MTGLYARLRARYWARRINRAACRHMWGWPEMLRHINNETRETTDA